MNCQTTTEKRGANFWHYAYVGRHQKDHLLVDIVIIREYFLTHALTGLLAKALSVSLRLETQESLHKTAKVGFWTGGLRFTSRRRVVLLPLYRMDEPGDLQRRATSPPGWL